MNITASFQENGGILHTIRLDQPAAVNKAEKPGSLAVISTMYRSWNYPMMPVSCAFIGSCGVSASPVPTFSDEFIFHIKLNPKSNFILPTHYWVEYAAFIPAGEISINGQLFANSELVTLSHNPSIEIKLSNNSIHQADLLIFGGRPYTETIVAQGPFVMNSRRDCNGL